MKRSAAERARWSTTVLLATCVGALSIGSACGAVGDSASAGQLPGTQAAAPGATETRATTGTLLADTMWSQSLGTNKRLRIYLPPSYALDTTQRFPVVYYLHGLTGNEDRWLEDGRMAETMDSLVAAGGDEAIIVMPDGDNSWYTAWHSLPSMAGCRADTSRREPVESFCVPWPRYDDYIARDLVAFVDGRLRTLADREHRAIAGLSMGGYGAVTLALRYPDVYVAAASHSGVLAPALLDSAAIGEPARLARTNRELRQLPAGRRAMLTPAFGRDTISWFARDPGRLATRLVTAGTEPPALRIDCGVDDNLLGQNRAFVTTLRTLGVSHQYAEHPGGHTWTYWRDRLPGSLGWLLQQMALSDPGES